MHACTAVVRVPHPLPRAQQQKAITAANRGGWVALAYATTSPFTAVSEDVIPILLGVQARSLSAVLLFSVRARVG